MLILLAGLSLLCLSCCSGPATFDLCCVAQIVVMEEGRVVESGSHTDLLQKGGAYAKLWAQNSVDDAASHVSEGTSYAAAAG